jgi:hypothetical protein
MIAATRNAPQVISQNTGPRRTEAAMCCDAVAVAWDIPGLPQMLEINFRIPQPLEDMHTMHKWRTR